MVRDGPRYLTRRMGEGTLPELEVGVHHFDALSALEYLDANRHVCMLTIPWHAELKHIVHGNPFKTSARIPAKAVLIPSRVV